MKSNRKEIVIIGSGIIGSFIAHELSQYEVHVTILEKRGDICEEVSAANSAIVHAGYDPEEGTLKGRLNKRGADMYPLICERLHVDYLRCGALVLACGSEEERELEILYQRALHRNVQATYLNVQEIKNREPNISDHVTKAMDVPETAIITPWEVCYALMDECLINGVQLHLQEEVIDIRKEASGVVVQTNKQSYVADLVINAAGLGAQRIMEMVEDTSLFSITPKRGQYFILSKRAEQFVHEVLYPVPSITGKGVLCIPTVHGNILLGPNNEGVKEEDTSTTAAGLADVKEKLAKTVQNVPYQEVIHSYSGLRPCGNHNDFFLEHSPNDQRIIHCGCIDSPGLASAPAIAEYVVQELILPQGKLTRKVPYHARHADIRLKDVSFEDKQNLIHAQPRFGHIICRCEEISEQEVIDCIHRPCGARSIKGVKKRVRPGTGKCQGGFCEIEVAKILSRELHIPLDEVCFDSDAYFAWNKGGK